VNRLGLFCLAAATAVPALTANGDERFFDRRVAPILIRRCLPCHNDQLKNGELSFAGRNSVLKGGSRGPAIVPGRPEQSLLIQSLRHDGDLQMPPGPKLPAAEIKVLTQWIERGAPWGTKLGPATR
jgi:hypothetical protein